VLRSPGVFEKAALEAVRQWRYSPVILNGRAEKFILTVTVSFRLDK
jgi:outer membrane biosynthesis protein TonB